MQGMQSMSVLMKVPNLFMVVMVILMALCSTSHVQHALVYLVHLMLPIDPLLVLCAPSNKELNS